MRSCVCLLAALGDVVGPASVIVELWDDIALDLNFNFIEGLGFHSSQGCRLDVGLGVLHTYVCARVSHAIGRQISIKECSLSVTQTQTEAHTASELVLTDALHR